MLQNRYGKMTTVQNLIIPNSFNIALVVSPLKRKRNRLFFSSPPTMMSSVKALKRRARKRECTVQKRNPWKELWETLNRTTQQTWTHNRLQWSLATELKKPEESLSCPPETENLLFSLSSITQTSANFQYCSELDETYKSPPPTKWEEKASSFKAKPRGKPKP